MMAAGGVIGAGISVASSMLSQSIIEGKVDWRKVAVAAGTGFVSGAITASPLGVWGQRIANWVISAGSYGAECYFTDESFTWYGFATCMAFDVVSFELTISPNTYFKKVEQAGMEFDNIVAREIRRTNANYANKVISSSLKAFKENIFMITSAEISVFTITTMAVDFTNTLVNSFLNSLKT